MALKDCTVVVHDLNQTAHAIDVTAESLYEAIAQALATLRGHDWVGDIGRGLTTVTVKVRNPEVTHVVKIQDFENWLNRSARVQQTMSDVKVLDLPQYQSNVVRQPHRFHTTSMGVREVLVDFLCWIALGLMAVLALIVIVGIGIPRRTPVTLRRRLHDVDPR